MSEAGMKAWALVPEQFQGGLERYVDEGILPGRALTALLENDLKETFGRFDNDNNIRPILQWLYNNAPSPCWGSKANVASWMNRGGALGVLGFKVAREGV